MRYKAKGIWIVLTVICLVVLVGMLGFESLQAAKLEVSGNARISAEEIIKLSGIEPGTSMLKVNFEEARDALKLNPYIELERIERMFPDTVVLHVNERVRAAGVETDSGLAIVDEHGVLLEVVRENPGDGLLIVKGMHVTKADRGEVIEAEDPLQLAALLKLLAHFRGDSGAILAVNLDNPVNIECDAEGGYVIKLGDANELGEKFEWMNSVMEQRRQEEAGPGTLDVSTGQGASLMPDGQ